MNLKKRSILIGLGIASLFSGGCTYSHLKNPGVDLGIYPTFLRPLRGKVTTRFGWRHEGIDIAAPSGTKIVAASDGVVVFSGNMRGYGRTVMIEHADGVKTLYAHLQKRLVKKNKRVLRGQVIGTVGSTGRSTGPHLHFETRRRGKPHDPELFMPLFDSFAVQ